MKRNCKCSRIQSPLRRKKEITKITKQNLIREYKHVSIKTNIVERVVIIKCDKELQWEDPQTTEL